MARLGYNVRVTAQTPSATPWTLLQILAATNTRCMLHALEIMPKGVAGTDPPVIFELQIQSTAGNLTSYVTDITDDVGVSETRQTTFLTKPSAGAEPTKTDIRGGVFSLHPQGSRTYIPPMGPIPILGGERLGVVWNSATYSAIELCAWMTE